MTPFALLRPATLQEASQQIAADPDGHLPMGGGTALALMMKTGVLAPQALVSLRDVAQGRGIERQADGALHIGAQVTLSQLEHDAQVKQAVPVIARAMKRLSNVRVRNVATVGGCLAHADPHMDLPPLLCALGARVRTVSAEGGRELAVEDLITGYYETALQRGELIASLDIPAQGERRSTYVKLTTRAADDWPALGIAVALELRAGVIAASALFVGAATDRPTRLQAAQDLLAGQRPGPALFEQAGDAAAAAVFLRGDERGSASYKKELLRVHLRRALQALCEEEANA